jgi:signal transduction histidine kinase
MQRTAKSMQHLLGDLLDMASIQAGRLSIEQHAVDLGPMLVEACDSQQAMARAKGLVVLSEFAVDGLPVMCDRGRILQVLANLLGNAIKFCEAGDSVTCRAGVRDGEVLVAVSDTGPGIPAEQLESIFEPYRTVQPRDGASGTGLGLYITKGIVERHGGRMWVESEVGVGSTFFFTLLRA